MMRDKTELAKFTISGRGNIYLFFGAALFCFIAYAMTWGTGWTFDDTRILQGLGSITNLSSALKFITTADTGSLTGRPISIATFLMNIGDWPSSPSGFRRVNALWHIFNAALLTWISFKIAKLIPRLQNKALGFSVALGIIWMLHPFLASTSFHLIQRMVLVAATFSLLGVLIYLYGRSLMAQRPAWSFAWMSIGLIIAGGIGFFAKENAALTPIMVGVTEFTLLSRFAPISHRHLKLWRTIFFVMPIVILSAYFIYYITYKPHTAYDSRNFSLIERLLSEPIILLEYVQQIFLPRILSMGPYQNDLARIHHIGWASISALLFWVIAVVTAFAFRKRWPAFSFSVLFFLAGHLLESTVIGLELYFEHRNYLPSIGLLGGAVGVIWASDKAWLKYTTYAYAMVMAILLWQLNTLWGNPFKSAQTWAKMHPTSPRAMQQLPTLYQRIGKYDIAAKLVLRNYRNDPMSGGFAAYVLISKCFSKDKNTLKKEISQIIHDAPVLRYGDTTTETLGRMLTLASDNKCPSFESSQLINVVKGLMKNPKYHSDMQQLDTMLTWAQVLSVRK